MASAPLREGYLQTELLQLWRTVLESDGLTIDDDFFEKGGDSLLANEMVLEAERRLGVSIPEWLLFEASSIRTLTEILSNSAKMERKTVFPVSETTTGVSPLLFFHGEWTHGGFYLKEFARAFGREPPLVAVAPHGIGGGKIPPSIEEMAADRVPDILDFQPRGPYRLGGHCVGGMVALEAARLLAAKGEEVQIVAMIDPIWTSGGQPWPTLNQPPRPANAENSVASQDVLPNMTATVESVAQYSGALEIYSPSTLQVPIVIFSSIFDGTSWREVSGDFTLLEFPGDHFDLVTSRASIFVVHFREQLQRVAGGRAVSNT